MLTGSKIRKIIFAVLVLLAASFLTYQYFLSSARPPATSTYKIDMDEIRSLAKAPNTELPQYITVAKITDHLVPAIMDQAGKGWRQSEKPRYSFQLVYKESRIILDTALTKDQSDYFPNGTYYPDAYDRTVQAIETADLILATHEHIDHIGTLAAHPNLRGLMNKVILTREQFEWAETLQGVKFPAWFEAEFQPLDFENYHAVAPGVVLIKAPGHTPGSLLVFVVLADGTEALFVGDIAFKMSNITDQMSRPRLMSNRIGEDRPAVLNQLRTLIDLHALDPDLKIIVAHDGEQIDRYLSEGWMTPLTD